MYRSGTPLARHLTSNPETRRRFFSTACRMAQARTYADAVAALNTLQSNYATIEAIRKSGKTNDDAALTQMVEWAAKLGYAPSDFDRLNIIHIAGTKGKGSTCAFISSILQQYIHAPQASSPSPSSASPQQQQPVPSGHISKVGLYTSPHLRFVRERIKINDEPLPEPLFARYFFEVWDRLEAAAVAAGVDPKAPGSKPVYFRYLTLMAFHTFLSEGVDATVLECGIGGQYDSTNIIEKPRVTGITRLGIDHVGLLGDTIDKIAWQKAGIMKQGAPAFTVPQVDGAMPVLRSRAAERGVTLTVTGAEAGELDPASPSRLRLGLAGEFQYSNASLAVAISAAFLRTMGIAAVGGADAGAEIKAEAGDHANAQAAPVRPPPLPERFRSGLEQVKLGGRCETRVEGGITWHIDGGHTLDSIEASAKWFASSPGSLDRPLRVLIFNQQTRDAVSLAKALYATLRASNPDLHFTHALFCTNVTFREAGYRPDLVSINTNSTDVDHLSVQRKLASAWKDLDETSEVHVLGTIEEAVELVRRLQAEKEGADGRGSDASVLVTGSLHLVGGLLEVLESAGPPQQNREILDNTTDLDELDVFGGIAPPSTAVHACLEDGFAFENGVRIAGGEGALLVDGEVFRWKPWETTEGGKAAMLDPKGRFDVPEAAWGLLKVLWPKPDLLILGLGAANRPLSPETRQHITSLGIRIDAMDTRNAAAQYNMLATERGVGDVAAALLPIGWTGKAGA
ncbi:Folylpolyglutamate synthetase [Ascosphaera acerosa]|nr:Folylpolyglutamate synthetase [Ascosphaera acerosa]